MVDPITKREVQKIPTTGPPYAVSQMSDDGRTLYVPTALSVVDVIDTTTNRVVRTIPVVIPPGPAHVEISRDEKVLYSYASTGTITGYDTLSGAMVRPPIQTIGLFPGWGARSIDGSALYVINYFGGISTVDVTRWRVAENANRPLTTAPLSATITPNGRQVWMANVGDNTIEVLDTATGATVTTIRTANPVSYIGFSADGTDAYLSDLGLGKNLPVNTLGLGQLSLAGLPGRGPGKLVVLDTRTFAQKRTIPVGNAPVAGVY